MRQLPLGVIIAETASRKLLFTNPRAQELLGRARRSDSIAGPHAELIHRALEGDSTSRRRDRRAAAPTARSASSRSAPSRCATRTGEIVAAVATLFDLTEHRQREEALAFLAEASVALTETLDVHAHARASWSSSPCRASPTGARIDMLEHGEIRNVGRGERRPRNGAARPARARAPAGARAGVERRLGRDRAPAARS